MWNKGISFETILLIDSFVHSIRNFHFRKHSFSKISQLKTFHSKNIHFNKTFIEKNKFHHSKHSFNIFGCRIWNVPQIFAEFLGAAILAPGLIELIRCGLAVSILFLLLQSFLHKNYHRLLFNTWIFIHGISDERFTRSKNNESGCIKFIQF